LSRSANTWTRRSPYASSTPTRPTSRRPCAPTTAYTSSTTHKRHWRWGVVAGAYGRGHPHHAVWPGPAALHPGPAPLLASTPSPARPTRAGGRTASLEWSGVAVSDLDGPTLRSVRESVNVPLRRIARIANMSHGHLSKMERGEAGRPVTPAVLAAYEKATGIRLTNTTSPLPASVGGWRQGALSDARRRAFNAEVASLAV